MTDLSLMTIFFALALMIFMDRLRITRLEKRLDALTRQKTVVGDLIFHENSPSNPL